VRALLVLILFVVVTVLVLSEIHPTTTKAASEPASVSTTTTTPSNHTHHSTTTTTTTTPPSKVPVVVANASGINGAAAAVTAQLKPDGWALLPPTNASAEVTASHVYYVAGFKPEADAIASSLQLPATSVGPYTTAAPISSIGTADVAVVVGPDLADKTNPSSTS
jgi:cytoskeletal protein RodZ